MASCMKSTAMRKPNSSPLIRVILRLPLHMSCPCHAFETCCLLATPLINHVLAQPDRYRVTHTSHENELLEDLECRYECRAIDIS